MTLVTALSADDRYLLMTADSAVIERRSGRRWPGLECRDKAFALTRYVLCGTTGDVAVTAEFHARLRAAVDPTDDLDACVESAQRVIKEMWAENRRGPERVLSMVVNRRSIREEAALSVILNGYLGSGGSAIYISRGVAAGSRRDRGNARLRVLRAPAGRRASVVSDPGVLQLVSSVPAGTNSADTDWFNHVADLERLERLRSPAGAFERAFTLHRHIGETYHDLVSDDVNVVLIVGRSDGVPPAPIAFSVDWREVERAEAVYQALAAAQQDGETKLS